MKKIIVIFASIVIIIIAIVVIYWLAAPPSGATIEQELENIVKSTAGNDKPIKNTVLSVMKGDGSFAWSGAAGIAKQCCRTAMTKDTPIYIASITKMYTAAAVMLLYEKGELALDDPTAKYLPEDVIRNIHVFDGHDYSNEITVEQLLSHTSGIADYYSEKTKGGKTLFEVFSADAERTWTVDETIERVRSEMAPNFPPGTDASYSDTNYQLLGKIIEARTRKTLQVVFEEYFFRPLGLKHTWLVGYSKPQVAPPAEAAEVFSNGTNITKMRSNGAYWADGGIVSTVEDSIIFLKALKEGKIVKADTLKLMHQWHPLKNLPMQYGIGTMYFEVPSFINRFAKVPPIWGHTGSTGSFLYYAEDMDLFMAGTIDQTEDRITPFVMMIKAMKVILTRR